MTSSARAHRRRPRPSVGRVLVADCAGADVLTSAGPVRVTWGGGLLVAGACPESGGMPRRGDAVRLVHWPDGRVTAEQVIMRPVPAAADRPADEPAD